MTPTARHRTVEARFRALVDAHGMDPPDAVEYEPHGVTFLWHGQQVAVAVDFDDLPADLPVAGPPVSSA